MPLESKIGIIKIYNMITLTEKYYITNDSHNVVLRFSEMREKVQKDGTVKQYEAVEDTYHGSIKNALHAFLKNSVNDSENIVDILKKIKEVEEKINQLSEKQLKEIYDGNL